jgi:hypothetical protein
MSTYACLWTNVLRRQRKIYVTKAVFFSHLKNLTLDVKKSNSSNETPNVMTVGVENYGQSAIA